MEYQRFTPPRSIYAGLVGVCALLASAIPATPALAQATDQAAANADEAVLEEIVVQGRRAAIENAALLERMADEFKSIITADDVGQFGDVNVAESLQRVPGVSITRAGGEGQQISIRGMPVEFATVTVDGVRLGTRDDKVSASNLDVIGADNLQQVEVVKTLTPERDADAIAGSVDLKTLSALTMGRDTFNFHAQGQYADKSEDFNSKLSGRLTRIMDTDFGRMGFASALSWEKRDTTKDDARVADGLRFLVVEDLGNGETEFDDASNCSGAILACYLSPNEFDLRSEPLSRERLSLSVGMEFELTDSHLFELRGTLAQFEQSRLNNRQTFALDRANRDSEIFELGVNSGRFIDERTERRFLFEDQDDDIYTLSARGTSFLNTDWTLSYGADFSKNDSVTRSIEGRFRADDIGFEYWDLDAYGIQFEMFPVAGEDDPFNPADYAFHNNLFNQREAFSVDENSTFFIASEHLFAWSGREAAFKFGVKYRERDRDYDFNRNEYDEPAYDSLADFGPISNTVPHTDFPILFQPDLSLLESSLRNSARTSSPIDPASRDGFVFVTRNSLRDDYVANEEILAAFIQLTFNPTDNMQLIAGVRYEDTDYSSTGTQFFETVFNDDATDVLADALVAGGVADADVAAFVASRIDRAPSTPLSGGKTYSEFFPSVNLRWEPTDTVVVRASYTEGIKRPEYGEAAAIYQMNTREQIDEDDVAAVINGSYGGALNSVDLVQAVIDQSLGGDNQYQTRGLRVRNPNLNPLVSQNLDASISWYPNERTVLSIAGFYKKIEDYVLQIGVGGDAVTAFGFLPETGGFNCNCASSIATFINGDSATIQGIELNYYQAYDFLPGFMSGLFVQLNATYADSEATASQVTDRKFSFPEQSDWIGNMSLGWESDTVSLRVAGVYQGDRLRGLNQAFLDDPNDPAGDLLEDERTSWDFNARWMVADGWQLYFDALNLNEADDARFYRGNNTASTGPIFGRIESYGRTYNLGLRVNF